MSEQTCESCKKVFTSPLLMAECDKCHTLSCWRCNGIKENKPRCPKCGYNFGLEHSSEKKSGCFIATACYGTDTAPDVLTLRTFRDSVLISSKTGRAFVDIYYLISPPIAKMIATHYLLRSVVRQFFVQPIANLCRSKIKKHNGVNS